MATAPPPDLRRQAASGMLALLLRQVATLALYVPATILLARLLSPVDFGVYAVLTFIVWILEMNLSLGLAAWLIQMRDEPTELELRTVFSLQLALCAVAFVLLWVTAPAVVRSYGQLAPETLWLLRALGLSVLLLAFRTVPVALLERSFRYGRLAMVEFAASASYHTLAVVLAALGYRTWSLVAGLLASSLIALILLFGSTWWCPRLHVDRPTARRVFAFSSPWQLQKWLTLLKDNIVPTFVAARFGPQAVGYLTLASTTAQRSTQLLPVLDRVAFATYARLQGDDARLRSAVEFTLFLAAAVIMPTSFLLGALAEPLVLLLYGEKWLPSVPAIRWFAVSAIVSSLNWTTMSTFIATGRPWVPLRITVVWTVLLWSLTLLFCGQYGFTGYALAEAASGVLTLWPARELRRQLGVNVFGVTWRVLLATSAAGLAAFALSLLVSFTLVSLVATGALLGILLYGVIAVLEPTRTLMGLAEVRRWAPATFAPVVDSVARLIRTGSPGRSPWP